MAGENVYSYNHTTINAMMIPKSTSIGFINCTFQNG